MSDRRQIPSWVPSTRDQGGGGSGAGGSSGAVIGMRSGKERDLEGSTLYSSEALDPDFLVFNDDGEHAVNFSQTGIWDLWAGSSAKNQEMGEKKYRIWQPGLSSERIPRLKRAWVVHSAWASIENVGKISSRILVNKLQCEHIADHFKVTAGVLEKLGLGKDFVSGEALEGGSGIYTNLTFDEMHFSRIAETFEKRFMIESVHWEAFENQNREVSRMFKDYVCELDAQDGSREESLSKKPKIRQRIRDHSFWEMKMNLTARPRYRLDEFLCSLLGVLKRGEDLVLFHSGLEGASKGVVEQTGPHGEKIVEIHELLYKLLESYACLEHCEGTEFARGYLSRPDVCGAKSIFHYWNSSFLPENVSLDISNNFLSIEMATRIAELLKGSNCALKMLSIESLPGVKVDQEELRKCRLLIIAAFSESVGITSLTVRGANGEEVHELCKSLSVNKVLENLVISIHGPLADNDAMELSAMLKERHSLKSCTLEFDDVSPEGVVYLGAMLAEISLDEIYLRSRGFSRVDLKYLLGLSMNYMDGKRNFILSLNDHVSFLEIERKRKQNRIVFEGRDSPVGESDCTQKLCVTKTLNHFSIKFTDLDSDAVCEILDSLKKNKTLQGLELESWPRCSRNYDWNYGDNLEVAACLEVLLAENSNLRQLRIINYLDSGLSSNAKLSPSCECVEVVESIARMLRTNKTLSHFSMINGCLSTSDICEIVDSLKTNKALQVLQFECKVFNDLEVEVAFIDLLVNHNFTLSTIKLCGIDEDNRGMGQDIETFMTNWQLKFDTKMNRRELWSLVCTTSDSPMAKQVVGTLPLQKGEGSTKEVCGSSKRTSDKHKSKVEAKDERPRLFLSYSNEMRDFARLLCMELKSSNYNVVDQDSINFVEVVDQCQLAIVVLSDMYVNSKPSMSELCTIVKSKRTNNPALKVYPLFYKLTLQDLQNAYVSASTFDGEGISLDIASEREALSFLCEGKNEVSRKANDLVENLSQGRVDVGKFCGEFSELQRRSWPSNGMEFEKNATSEEGYLHAILEEILHYIPIVKECNSDQISGHQGKLEMESKLSLRQMKSLLESLPMSNFYLHRKLNMAQSLQEKYIQYSSFEEMCPPNLSLDQKHEYSKGRITAALFPTTFLYYFKVHMFQGPHGGNFRPMLKAVAALVARKMQKECNHNGVQTSTFFDFFDFGAPLDPKRMIALCQNFSAKTLDGSKQLVMVQDVLTGAYYYQCVEASDLGNPTIGVTIGVIGVQVTSKEIHIDNIHEDGSSYSGVLEDFSYKIDFDENKQCAAKAFGDHVGARFLSKNIGIKCSPLFVIALASAIQKKGLTLTWRNGKGHIEFYPKVAQKVKVEVEASACQIQYTSNINLLGLDIEWGTGTNSCAPRNQTFQRGIKEIVNQQVLRSNVDQGVGTSSFRDDGIANVLYATNLQNDIALYSAVIQDKSTLSGGIQIAGNGANFSYETCDSETKQVQRELLQDLCNNQYASKGGFHRISTLDVEYPNLEKQLLRCQLHEVHDHNYLVVYNVSKARHINIYEATKQNGAMPNFELTWISDILIAGGEKQIKRIFETRLKGRELIVRRDNSNFTQLWDSTKPLDKSVPG